MRLNKAVLLAALSGIVVGAAGGVVGTRLVDGGRALSLSAEPILQPELTCAPARATPRAVAEPRAVSAPAAVLASSDAPTRPQLIEPQVSAVRKPDAATGDGFEGRLHDLLERPLPKGREIVRNDRDDGGVMTYEQLDDGTSINRTFSPTGTLKAESMYTIGGDKIQKSYYESGRTRGLSWVRADGSRTDVKLSPEGLFEGRQELLPDGTKIVSKYDGSGNLTGRWRVLKNGHSVRL